VPYFESRGYETVTVVDPSNFDMVARGSDVALLTYRTDSGLNMHTVVLEENGEGKFTAYNLSNSIDGERELGTIEDIIGSEGSPIVMIGVHK
jgi:hypothetical protein